MRGFVVASALLVTLCGPVWAAEEAKVGADPFATHGPEEPTEDAKEACARVLQVIRGQVELYKLQHEDRYPTTSGRPVGEEWQWELMTRKTKGERGRDVGPYVRAVPVNPVTRSSKVVGKPEAGAGWLVDENGRLSALDMKGSVLDLSGVSVVGPPPTFARGSVEARMSAARSTQQTIQAQLELYKLQHGDQYPTRSGEAVAAEWSWEMLTKVTTDPSGRKVGPYLVAPAVNALTNSSRVVAKPEQGAGWVLTEEGIVQAVTAEGKVLE